MFFLKKKLKFILITHLEVHAEQGKVLNLEKKEY